MLVSAIALLVVGLVESSNDIVSNVQRCKAGDSHCLASTMTHILRSFPSGIPELEIPSLDPCFIGDEKTNQGSGTVSVKLSLFEGWIYGWSNASITSVVGFGKDPRSTIFEMYFKVPNEIISASYSVNGRILLIPINGKGKTKIRFNHLVMSVKLITSVESKDDEDYLKINKVLVDISCHSMHVQFDNLYNNAALSRVTNKMLNDNSMLVFNEVKHTFGLARAKVFERMVRPFFAKYPYRSLFADE